MSDNVFDRLDSNRTLFERLVAAGDADLEVNFPMYPIGSPGLSPPGESFVRHAAGLSAGPVDQANKLNYLCRRAMYDERFVVPIRLKDKDRHAQLVPGHLWGYSSEDLQGGPHPARVMVVGKCPVKDELQERRYMVGDRSALFRDTLLSIGVTDAELATWYVTAVCKWASLTPATDTIPASHLKECKFLLEQELRLVKPDIILCMGADAGKWFFGPNGSVTNMIAKVSDYSFCTNRLGEPDSWHTAKVTVCHNISAVYRKPELHEAFKEQLSFFKRVLVGENISKREKGIRCRNIYKLSELRRVVDAIRQQVLTSPDPLDRIIAVDGEWHGAYPDDPGAYLRTIQFCASPTTAYCVVLRHEGGASAFKPGVLDALAELRRLFKYDAKEGYHPRIGGHFFRADLPWLKHSGIDLTEEYLPAATPELARTSGGWDTSHMAHANNETALFGLTETAVRWTSSPVYDHLVKEYVADYCKLHGIKKEALEGYGFLPKWILHPEPTDPEGDYNYAGLDASVTYRIARRFMSPGGPLDSDVFGNDSWLPYWLTHRASEGVRQMEEAGISLDKPLVDKLTVMFRTTYDLLLQGFRDQIRWPTFNPDSVPQCVAFVFGDKYGYKLDSLTKARISVRPEGAVTLGLTPIKSTGKPPMQWTDVVAKGKEEFFSPSVDKESLGILGHEHTLAMQLRDLKFIGQVMKGALRDPNVIAGEDAFETDADGNYVYDKGVAGSVCLDGKVRTHISQNKETGRYSSYRPNLMAISKRREADYRRICGFWETDKKTGIVSAKGDYLDMYDPKYTAGVRSIFKADEGCVLVEADYVSAEVAGIAWLAQDRTLMDRVDRSALSPDHPDYLDIHSLMAVKAFKLDCAPTKKGLESIDRLAVRVAAKCVAEGTRLHTSQGFVRVETLAGHLQAGGWEACNGSVYLANDSTPTPLIGVFNGGIKPCITMTTEFGYSLTTTREHQYRTITAEGEYTFKLAGELQPDDWVAVRNACDIFGDDDIMPAAEYRHRTNSKPFPIPTKVTDDWAAFLGLWVSEGSAADDGSVQFGLSVTESAEFVSLAEPLLQRIGGDRLTSSGVRDNGVAKWAISATQLARWLRLHGGEDCSTRRVPDFVFSWSQDKIATFLRWLFEGDGSLKVQKPKGNRVGCFDVSYSTSSNQLAEDVKVLLNMFGVTVKHVIETRADYDGKYHAITVRGNRSRKLFMDNIGFLTRAKTARSEQAKTYRLDREVIPNQEEHLRAIRPYMFKMPREKCSECLRANKPVALSPTRLKMFLDNIKSVGKELPPNVLKSVEHLTRIQQLPAVFQRVKTLVYAGNKQVYDVTTTGEHVVSYGGILTHQSVMFGIPYGRGAAAIARQCREEGTHITTEECQALIDLYFAEYPEVYTWLEEAKALSQDPRWLMGSFGRYRRFSQSRDKQIIGDQQRQACNFPVQNIVADALSTAIYNFSEYKRTHPEAKFHMVLPVHDALLFNVPIPFLEEFLVGSGYSDGTVVPPVLQKCMVDDVHIRPRRLTGEFIPIKEPYHFLIESEVMLNWGEKLTKADKQRLGIAELLNH